MQLAAPIPRRPAPSTARGRQSRDLGSSHVVRKVGAEAVAYFLELDAYFFAVGAEAVAYFFELDAYFFELDACFFELDGCSSRESCPGNKCS
ncbi:MAG: hypothetical protein VB934_09715 [Polyangiaceae bacterium]